MLLTARITVVVLFCLLPGLVSPYLCPSAAARTRAVVADHLRGGGGDPGVVSKQQPSRTSQLPDSNTARRGPDKRGPMQVFSDIETGWNTERVEMILKHFGENKVTISIEGTGPSGGQFSRNQSYYLLKDMFKYTITRKFEIVQYRSPGEKGASSFAVAERFYQKTDDGRLYKDKIYVSLHAEPGADGNSRWVIDEIKSIR